MRLAIRVLFVLTVCLTFTVESVARQHTLSREGIRARIKPVSSVNIAEAPKATASDASSPTTQSLPESTSAVGEAIYKQYCALCHTSGLAGAPKIGDAADWQPHLEHGMDAMLEHVEKGYNAMPMKGTCMTCDAAQLKAAIEYMLPKEE